MESRNKETAPGWCVLPRAKRCVATIAPGFKRWARPTAQIAPDVARYKLEQGPLGEKLFRTDFGSYKEGELGNGTFSEFADARTLKNFNAKFISRDRRDAEPGDLLFFHQPWVQKFPYHVMIFLGPANLGDQGSSTDWVVYHTGASGQRRTGHCQEGRAVGSRSAPKQALASGGKQSQFSRVLPAKNSRLNSDFRRARRRLRPCLK